MISWINKIGHIMMFVIPVLIILSSISFSKKKEKIAIKSIIIGLCCSLLVFVIMGISTFYLLFTL